jgi:hypothetical protein
VDNGEEIGRLEILIVSAIVVFMTAFALVLTWLWWGEGAAEGKPDLLWTAIVTWWLANYWSTLDVSYGYLQAYFDGKSPDRDDPGS